MNSFKNTKNNYSFDKSSISGLSLNISDRKNTEFNDSSNSFYGINPFKNISYISKINLSINTNKSILEYISKLYKSDKSK